MFIKCLSEVPTGFRGKGTGDTNKPVFSSEDVKKIVEAASSQEAKDNLKKATQEALDRGAFGAPWIWVTNSKGEGEPFFGSDRYESLFAFGGLC